MKPERNRTRIIRLYKIEEILLTNQTGLSAVELAHHFSVDRRTIYRDQVPSYRPKIVNDSQILKANSQRLSDAPVSP